MKDWYPIIGTLGGAALATSVSWALYRANRGNLNAQTDQLQDDTARRLREDLMLADTLIAKLRAEVAWLWYIITHHWSEHHPDEPLPKRTPEVDDDSEG